MGDIIHLEAENHFGVCPKCKSSDGHLNIGRTHWFFCKKHRVKWRAGHDIFPDWRQETLVNWKHNESLLDFFMEIEPFQPWKFEADDAAYFDAPQEAKVLALRRGGAADPDRGRRLMLVYDRG